MALNFFKKFSQTKLSKLKKEIFVVPQIRKIFEDSEFEKALNTLELHACHAFQWMCSNFLKNFRSPSYQEGVAELLALYKELECRMFLKMHFLHLHLNFFLKIMYLFLLVLSRVNDFTKMFKQLKKGIKEFGMRV